MLYSGKDALDGWDTYAGSEKEGFQRTSSLASLKLAAHSSLQRCLQEGYEVCSHWHRKLRAYGQRSLHMAASCKRGNQACREHTKHATSREEKYQKSHGHYLIQISNVKDVIKTVIQKSVFLVTRNVVQQTPAQTHSLARLTEANDDKCITNKKSVNLMVSGRM